jgi:hypothetical protein
MASSQRPLFLRLPTAVFTPTCQKPLPHVSPPHLCLRLVRLLPPSHTLRAETRNRALDTPWHQVCYVRGDYKAQPNAGAFCGWRRGRRKSYGMYESE